MATTDYAAFLASKHPAVPAAGFPVENEATCPHLFPFQREIVRWAVARGRAALFEERGLGKTLQQLDYARLVCAHAGCDALILAPLVVGAQTVGEGCKFGIPATLCRDRSDVRPGINVTNYEMLEHFDVGRFGCVVLDESSILKAYAGATKRRLVEAFAETPYRLCCTATPSPNDTLELGNHAEFLGIMSSHEMIARWFITDQSAMGRYRLKEHAAPDFFAWVASWAMAVRRPSDLGYPDDGYALPPLQLKTLTVPVDVTEDAGDKLFRVPDLNATGLHEEGRRTAPVRVRALVALINRSNGVLESTGNGDKLATCGNQSTPSGDEPSTNQTRKSASDDAPSPARPKRTRNTCGLTTRPTRNGTPSSAKHELPSEISNGASDTPATPSTKPRPSHRPEVGIRTDAATRDSGRSLGSPPPLTTPCSPTRADAAPSAGLPSATSVGIASTSITAMRPGLFADSSALPATSGSASSATTRSSFDAPHPTSASTEKPEPWLIWCNADYEQRLLEAAFGDRAISVYGSLPVHEKERRLLAWLNEEAPILITKPRIAGYGLNFQHCARTAFVGLSYSFEQLYQALGRVHRFGQAREVEAWIVAAETEGAIWEAVRRKMAEHERLMAGLFAAGDKLRREEDGARRVRYDPRMPMAIPGWLRDTEAA